MRKAFCLCGLLLLAFAAPGCAFGKTITHRAGLEIVDADPKAPFDFFLARS
jgi:hypothetical protein